MFHSCSFARLLRSTFWQDVYIGVRPSLELHLRWDTCSQKIMPGGVSSPVRAFKSVGGEPIVFDSVKGANCFDVIPPPSVS